jgi:hypothetical protein
MMTNPQTLKRKQCLEMSVARLRHQTSRQSPLPSADVTQLSHENILLMRSVLR